MAVDVLEALARLAASSFGQRLKRRVHGRARDEPRRDTAKPHDLIPDSHRRDELGAFDRLGLLGHRQEAGDDAAFPVVLPPSRRGSLRKPPEIRERQREQPAGPDRRRQRRQNEHRDRPDGDAGKDGASSVPELRRVEVIRVVDREHRQEVDARGEEKERVPRPGEQKSERHERESQARGRDSGMLSLSEGSRTPGRPRRRSRARILSEMSSTRNRPRRPATARGRR